MRKMILSIIIVICFISIFLFNYNNNLKVKTVNYNGNNLKISIDGVDSLTLPEKGNYYLVSYDCKSANTVVVWNNEKYELSVSNGNKKGNVACYLEFKSNPLLSEMKTGSYVEYVGNNGCSGKSCNGYNANYASDDKMGYCNDSNYQFIANGFRIAYVKDRSAYLISAGALDCINGNSLDNFNKIALKYCNLDYSNDRVCDSSTVWAMNSGDFKMITNINISDCNGNTSSKECGYNNDLIDNGSYYFLRDENRLSWSPVSRGILMGDANSLNGVRPVIKLSSNVVVLSGDGSYNNPYKIGNNSFWINDDDIVKEEDKYTINLNLMSANASKMCISVDTSVCDEYIDFSTSHMLEVSNVVDEKIAIYVYYRDDSGKVVATLHDSIDLIGA